MVPTVTYPGGDAGQRLLDRRTLMVSGALDHEVVTRLCAELMALDGESAGDIDVVVNSPGGPIEEVGGLLDVIELMRAPVRTTCVGTARGTAAVVVAVGTGGRRAASNATLSLRCPWPAEPAHGHADDVARAAEEARVMRQRLIDTLVAATGQTAETVAAEFDHGAVLDATAAIALGLVDEIANRPASGGST